MNRLIIATTLAGLAIAVPSKDASAQGYNPFQIGGAVGAAIPIGDLGNTANTGYNVTLALGYKPAASPLGFRFDAAYNEFGFEGGGGNFNIPSFTANLVYDLPSGGFSPYLIGGAGLYRPSASATGFGSASENRFGFNAGGGVKMPLSGFHVFAEARYNYVSADGGNLSFIPITIGLMF